MKGKSCKLSIRLAHDGLVLSVKRSQGDVTLCESAKRAALKAKTLPIPKDPGIAPQFRDFDITVEPDL
jgi:colicin import membrane protein